MRTLWCIFVRELTAINAVYSSFRRSVHLGPSRGPALTCVTESGGLGSSCSSHKDNTFSRGIFCSATLVPSSNPPPPPPAAGAPEPASPAASSPALKIVSEPAKWRASGRQSHQHDTRRGGGEWADIGHCRELSSHALPHDTYSSRRLKLKAAHATGRFDFYLRSLGGLCGACTYSPTRRRISHQLRGCVRCWH